MRVFILCMFIYHIHLRKNVNHVYLPFVNANDDRFSMNWFEPHLLSHPWRPWSHYPCFCWILKNINASLSRIQIITLLWSNIKSGFIKHEKLALCIHAASKTRAQMKETGIKFVGIPRFARKFNSNFIPLP